MERKWKKGNGKEFPKGNGKKEVEKLAVGELNMQHRCYRHEDEKFLFKVQSFLYGFVGQRVLS